MAAPYSDTAALANLVQAAYDRSVRLALRATPQFRVMADTKPVQQSMPGSSVVFNIHQDLAPATTPLNEVNDPTGVSFSNSTPVTVTLNEYGNFTVVTKKLQEFALDANLDTNVANVIAYNQADSIDKVVEAVLQTSTNRIYEGSGGQGVGAGTPTGPIKARNVRYAVAKLRGASVSTVDGVNYASFIHPDASHDLRVETGAEAWRAPHIYVDPANIYAGEIGTFEGVRFIETPRCSVSTGFYNTYVMGREALAEAVAQEFSVVVDGDIVDPLNRKTALGWYGIAGWSLFRPESMWRIVTTSTIS